LYPASLATSTTEEQRTEAASTGNLIPGSVDLGNLVIIDNVSANARVDGGKSSTVQVTFSVPKTFPDEMVGKTIEIPIIVKATDDSGNSDTVFVQYKAIELEIVS
ncbi:MAG: hypothetical protein ACRD38_13210, partial [Nitrososphaerales archaeon]